MAAAAAVVVVMVTPFKCLWKPTGNLTDLKQHAGTQTLVHSKRASGQQHIK
jgi:hypothetical protein